MLRQVAKVVAPFRVPSFIDTRRVPLHGLLFHHQWPIGAFIFPVQDRNSELHSALNYSIAVI